MTSLQSTGGVSFRSVANPKCCTHSISYQHWWWLSQYSWPETMRLLGQNYRKERQKRISSEHPTALLRPSSVETSTINMLGASQVVSAFLIKTIAVLFQIEFYSTVLHCQYLNPNLPDLNSSSQHTESVESRDIYSSLSVHTLIHSQPGHQQHLYLFQWNSTQNYFATTTFSHKTISHRLREGFV